MRSLFLSSVLSLLQIVPSEQSYDFLDNKTQYHLHTLLTEQRHPKTWDLSQQIKADTLQGIEALISVDEDICRKIEELSLNTAVLDQAVRSIKKAILDNKRIYVYGCGATGRLAKQVESSFWRPFWRKIQGYPLWKEIEHHFPNIENRLIGEMTGADRALISSLEGFEDLQLIGQLQLQDHKIQSEDVVFAVTEGGETSSVIGTILAASTMYKESSVNSYLYFIYNNPDELLLPFERSRKVLENEDITKICLATGPQSITGSTRMQATTSETFIMGIVIEQAIYEALLPHLSEKQLQELGFYPTTLSEKLLSFLPLHQEVFRARKSIAQLTNLEASTYEKGCHATYFAKDPLITVFTDSTERAPTFRLSPLDRLDSLERKSWIQVWTTALDASSAWEVFLGRPFKGLDPKLYQKAFNENIEDPYLQTAALRSLQNAGNDQQFLYDFSYSKDNVQLRGPTIDDLGVMVLFSSEIGSFMTSGSAFQNWLKLFAEKGANTALVLLSKGVFPEEDLLLQKVKALAPKTVVIPLYVDNSKDPLLVRQHIALKMLLNTHSTAVMAKLGKVVGNTMTSVNPGNLKLIGRATFLILSHVNNKLGPTEKISYKDANAILFDAIEYVKSVQKVGQNAEVALSIIRILEAMRYNKSISWEETEAILQRDGLENYLLCFSCN